MAINWAVFRQKMETNNPPAVAGVSPIEGGIITRHDDSDDMVRYCFYILIRAGNALGRYQESWRVQNAAKTALQVRQAFAIDETVLANNTEMLLLAPATATAATSAARSIAIGAPADPSDAQLLAGIRSGDDFSSVAVGNSFSRNVTRAVFNSDVGGSIAQAEFA